MDLCARFGERSVSCNDLERSREVESKVLVQWNICGFNALTISHLTNLERRMRCSCSACFAVNARRWLVEPLPAEGVTVVLPVPLRGSWDSPPL